MAAILIMKYLPSVVRNHKSVSYCAVLLIDAVTMNPKGKCLPNTCLCPKTVSPCKVTFQEVLQSQN